MPLLFHWQLWTGPRELTLRGAGVGLRAVAAGADARRAGGAAAAAARTARAQLDAAPAPTLAAALARAALAAGGGRRDRRAPPRVYFSIITIRNHYNLQTAGYDLGIENNLVWNAAHWNGPLFKTSVHAAARTATHIGLHETYISYLIGIPYRLAPRPETLLVLQSMLIGAAALPLFAFARRHLGAWTACLVALLFLFNAPLHGSNLYDFHYLPFAPLFLWTTLALLEARRDRWAAVAIVLTLANREDMSALLIVRRRCTCC